MVIYVKLSEIMKTLINIKTDRDVKISAQKLAKEIVKSMNTPKREINRPHIMSAAAHFYQLFPRLGDYLAGGIFNKK